MSAFGLKYYAELRSKFKSVYWRVEIAERGYEGISEEMKFAADSPLTITWEKKGDDFFVPVKGSEASINIMCFENFHYITLFTSDPRKFRVSIYRNTVLYWRGFVTADLYSENFTAPPYEVTIKAVDGFNLLSNVDYVNSSDTTIGKKSLWTLVRECIDLMELDVDIADWSDLYADGMDESISPLQQAFVDMDNFFKVYDKPTYRDVLELCLKPFASQIFQSNGAIHIRRAISLYNDVRPLSFYKVGNDFPANWLVTADGKTIVTANNEPILVEKTRDRIDSMWDSDIVVQGESTLDVTPAIRSVTTNVTNKIADNIVPQIGIYDLAQWTDEYKMLALWDENTLRLTGNDAHQNEIVAHKGYNVKKCSYKMTLEMEIATSYSQRTLGVRDPNASKDITVEYGVKLISDVTTYYLTDNDGWSVTNSTIIDTISTATSSKKKIEFDGFPNNGLLVFFIKQTLAGRTSGADNRVTSYYDYATFTDISIKIDTDDNFDKALSRDVIIDTSNNIDMEINLPISDLPIMPNDTLLYQLYLESKNSVPTRMWHNKDAVDNNTLTNHLVFQAIKFRQPITRRISGDIITGTHIDINTVIQDDKYLHAAYYINSLELNALTDNCNSELVEMPGLLHKDTPPTGDDCVVVAELTKSVKKIIKSAYKLVILTTDNAIILFDTVTRSCSELAQYDHTIDVHPADNAFCVVDATCMTAKVYDYRGSIIKIYSLQENTSAFTMLSGCFYELRDIRSLTYNSHQYYELNRLGVTYERAIAYRDPLDTSKMYGTFDNIDMSTSTIVVNTTTKAYFFDSRMNTLNNMSSLDAGSKILSMSDFYICANVGAAFKVYRRDSLSDNTSYMTYSGAASCASHTTSEVVWATDKRVLRMNFQEAEAKVISNVAGANSVVKALHYINGELYIVRENAIYKYVG